MSDHTSQETAIYWDPGRPLDERVRDLVGRMTLQEKISQMVHDAPGIERLGVPDYNWWNECLHGVGRAGVATVFPQAIGMAATWNPELIQRMAVAVSDEARAKHHEFVRQGDRGIYKGLTFWTPNINIFRDPRWGRGQETYGEDPFLTARIGVAMVRGLQGDHSRYLKVAATAKHYAVHSGPEADRHHFDAQASPRDLRQTYLPAFLFGLVIAAVFAAIMSSADSQLLVAASSVVRDFYEKVYAEGRELSQKFLVRTSRMVVFVLVAISLLAGFMAEDLVYWLVLFAWAGLGAALGPTSILALYWRGTTGPGVVAGMLTGAAVTILWRLSEPLQLYELIPGFAAGLLATVVVSLFTKKPEQTAEDFEIMKGTTAVKPKYNAPE